jgi:N-acetylmuramoyl-L-alanine amidase
LYYYTSKKGKKIAQILLKEIVNALGLKSRGIKGKKKEERGGYLLYYTYAPCVIGESFFIDNNKDLLCAQKKFEKLASAYAKTIDKVIIENIV